MKKTILALFVVTFLVSCDSNKSADQTTTTDSTVTTVTTDTTVVNAVDSVK